MDCSYELPDNPTSTCPEKFQRNSIINIGLPENHILRSRNNLGRKINIEIPDILPLTCDK